MLVDGSTSTSDIEFLSRATTISTTRRPSMRTKGDEPATYIHDKLGTYVQIIQTRSNDCVNGGAKTRSKKVQHANRGMKRG